MRPFYTHANPQPLTPGEIYQFDIEVLPISYVFNRPPHPARDRQRRLAVDRHVFNHPYHPTQIGTDTIHHDAAHASCLLLPVMV